MKQLFKDKNRRNFANQTFKIISSIKDGWLRLSSHITNSNSGNKWSIAKYNLSNVLIISNKLLSASDLMSGDNIRYFVEPFYSDGKINAYLSTQWRHVGGTNLDIGSLQDFINNEYKDLFQIMADSDGFVLYQVPDVLEYFEHKNTPPSIPLQKIFFGPPGTGKSTKVKQLIEQYGFEVVRTTFHPDTDYQSFVGGYKPVVVKNEENGKEEITYRYAPQTFTKVYVNACQNPDKRYLLIIEEINRGNCAQIFGDLFQCLDRNDEGWSDYGIHAEADLAKHLKINGLKSEIQLPPNLFIYATMNTSDQSLFPMDSAFKRRWDWEYVPIDYDKAKEFTIIVSEQHRYNWGVFIAKVNKQIVDVTGSEDKQLGTFFVKPVAGVISLEVFKSKVLFYLWSEVFKNQLKTGDTIFHYDKEDGTSEEFTFADLFEPGRDMDILPSFMQKLGVDLLDHVAAV